MFRGTKRHIGVFIIIFLLTGAYLFICRDKHQKEMNEYNRYELGILNDLIDKREFFRDSLKYQMDSVMLQLHRNTNYNNVFRYQTNRRMLQK